MKKALVLMSGGLDSMLAAQIMLNQGLHVEGLCFVTGFSCGPHLIDYEHNPRRKQLDRISQQLNIPIHKMSVVDEYQPVVFHPERGFGSKKVNPCLDCKMFMLKKAAEWITQHEFDFIVTGEVLGQRPMSQRRDTLHVVANASGMPDRLLRPLCAKHLPITRPEREGWVDREKLYDFNGRTRLPQMELARSFGWTDFPMPGTDCCFLIDPNFAKRWIDFKQYECSNEHYSLEDISRLKVGRHIRLTPKTKLIVGRNNQENLFLEKFIDQYLSLRAVHFPGPLTLIIGTPTQEDILLAAQIAARLGKGKEAEEVEMCVKIGKHLDESEQVVSEGASLVVMPLVEIPQEWYL